MHKLTQELLQHLPYRDSKEPDSNNYKIYRLLAEVIGTIQKHQQEIERTRNIDNATGKTLELIGSNYNQPREVDQDDDEYRLYIKTKIAADMSQGDIETLNEIARTVLGEHFIGISETWSNPLYKDDIAGIVIKIKTSIKKIPSILNRVRAAGVQLYYEAMLPDENLEISSKAIQYRARYPMTHEAKTASRKVDGNRNNLIVGEKYLQVRQTYKMTGETQTASVKNNISREPCYINTKQVRGGINYPMAGRTIVGGI